MDPEERFKDESQWLYKEKYENSNGILNGISKSVTSQEKSYGRYKMYKYKTTCVTTLNFRSGSTRTRGYKSRGYEAGA